MRLLLLAAAMIFCFSINAQTGLKTSPGTVSIPCDSLVKIIDSLKKIPPTVLFQYNDTVEVASLMYKGKKHIEVATPGYRILSGFVRKGADGKISWVQQPSVVGALDSKKRPVIAIQ